MDDEDDEEDEAVEAVDACEAEHPVASILHAANTLSHFLE